MNKQKLFADFRASLRIAKLQTKIFLATGFLGVLLSPFVFVQAATVLPSIPPPSPRALLYLTNSKSAVDSLRAHITAMDIVAPQIYAANAQGKLLGKPNQQILDLARDNGAQMMPLIVNQNFSQVLMHNLLIDDAAQKKLIDALVVEGRAKGYVGFQYDFEHMDVADRDLYSAFVKKSAVAFHAGALQLSVALAPKHSDVALEYGDGSWDNWTGAFDYQSIGASADFVSVMAYDDSKSVGPTASLPWVQSVLNYTLGRIPPEKVMLGIPFYTWVDKKSTGKFQYSRSYPAVETLLNSGKYLTKGWSEDLGVSFVTYVKGKSTYIAWYEDQKSFEKKFALVADHHLLGFSAWALGQEDPKIWASLATPQSSLALRR